MLATAKQSFGYRYFSGLLANNEQCVSAAWRWSWLTHF